MSTHAIEFVSLGPGDPELITLKSLRALQRAQVIVVPGVQRPQGLGSRAADIIKALDVAATVEVVPVPMSSHRHDTWQVYRQMADRVAALAGEGRRVAVGVEGDAGIYASMHYVMDLLTAQGLPTAQLPGIPSFVAAAAGAGLHLVSGAQRLVVVPGNLTVAEAERLLSDGCAVVVMKLSACWPQMQTFLHTHTDLHCAYYENVGLPTAFFSTVAKEIAMRRPPYFSMLLLWP